MLNRFGKILRDMRVGVLEMTQEEVAMHLGVTRGYVSMVEGSESIKPSWDLMIRFSILVGISFDQLLLELMDPEPMSERSRELLDKLRESLYIDTQ